MSRSTEPREDGCELPPVTCWPLVYGAGAVVVLGVVVAAWLFVGDWARPLFTKTEMPVVRSKEIEAPAARIERGEERPAVVADEGRAVVVARLVRERERMPGAPKTEALPETPDAPKAAAGVRLKSKGKPARPDAPRQPASELEVVLLRSLLEGSRELDLEADAGTGKALHEKAQKALASKDKGTPSLSEPMENLLEWRDDLRGLPLLLGKACQSDREQTTALASMSRNFRRAEFRRTTRRGDSGRASLSEQRSESRALLAYLSEAVSEKKSDRAALVRPIEQLYQAGQTEMRSGMVEALRDIGGDASTQALARRAVFDTSPAVREQAVEVLKKRERADARPVLLAALRHPWPPAAGHAALALVALADEGAVPRLKELLEEPDPSVPYIDGENRWVRRELVRVNHLGNCLLCHAASANERDPIRAPVPTRGQPLPEVEYYDRGSITGPAVRADVVYLRQDFSAWHRVEQPNKWPSEQRFDYLVQTRELTRREAEAAKKSEGEAYPRREAIRWALAQLEGEPLRR